MVHNERLKWAGVGFKPKLLADDSGQHHKLTLSASVSAVSGPETCWVATELHTCAKDEPVFARTPLPACCLI